MATPSSPYHSTDTTDPQVYHDYSDCPNGQQGLLHDLVTGWVRRPARVVG